MIFHGTSGLELRNSSLSSSVSRIVEKFGKCFLTNYSIDFESAYP
jgi:hypothetical protein